jgi:hypothetical protein
MHCVVHIINANDLWIIGDPLIEGVSTHSDKNIQLNAKRRAKYHMARNQNDDISFQSTTPGTQYSRYSVCFVYIFRSLNFD